jgi:hypothetical protein
MSGLQIAALVAIILVAVPIYMIILSACAYVGKILAIRAIYNRNSPNIDKNKTKEGEK